MLDENAFTAAIQPIGFGSYAEPVNQVMLRGFLERYLAALPMEGLVAEMEAEKVDTEETKQADDYAYNNAVDDCIRVVRTHSAKRSPMEDALHHLGSVLVMLAEFHPDDQCRAYEKALTYYNAHCPNARVEPTEGYSTRLVITGPLDIVPAPDAGAVERVAKALWKEETNSIRCSWDTPPNHYFRQAKAALAAMPAAGGVGRDGIETFAPTTLANCPEGLFLFDGELGFKSEYATQSKSNPQIWQHDAYCVESGEYFWGGTDDAKTREELIVTPLDIEALNGGGA